MGPHLSANRRYRSSKQLPTFSDGDKCQKLFLKIIVAAIYKHCDVNIVNHSYFCDVNGCLEHVRGRNKLLG